MEKKTQLLFVGRFQPFHIGHASAIVSFSKKYKKIKIGIGSRKKKRTAQNPFSAAERKKMILAWANSHFGSLKTRKMISFSFLDDFAKDSDWAACVSSRFSNKKFDAASANSLVLKLLKKEGFSIRRQPLLFRKSYQGSVIRKKISKNDSSYLKSIPAKLRKYMISRGEKIVRESMAKN